MTNKWIISSLKKDDEELRARLAQELSISPVLSGLLIERGVRTFEQARNFFRPALTQLHDPMLMADMDKAVERLNQAVGNKEKIMVYGDYDVDGTTAVAVVYRFLQQYTSNLIYYIPDRYSEGYGFSYRGIDEAYAKGVSLVVVLDCGIKAVAKVEYAREKGIDVIICDHHTPDAELPKAVAVLNPKREDCPYPYKHLSGCGIGFKLIQAFALSNEIPFSHITPLLDLVALSIASDIVPITGENRVLIYWGLKQINSKPCIGLKSIIEICNLTGKEICVSDIVFKIGPRINAAGRMMVGSEAVALLIEHDAEKAKLRGAAIDEYNRSRKDLDKNMTDEAMNFIDQDPTFLDKKSIVVFNPNWHKGIVGIVASRLVEKYYKPTIVLTCTEHINENGEKIVQACGSARSVQGFDLYAAIDSCRDLLDNFGGHLYAAGLSMKPENVEKFIARFENYVTQNINPAQLQPQIEVDAQLNLAEITPKFFNVLRQFAPFGPENSKPVFVTSNVFDTGKSRLVGKDKEHLKLDVYDQSRSSMGGIAFGMSQFHEPLKNGAPIDLCYTLEENSFNDQTSVQLMVRDIQLAK